MHVQPNVLWVSSEDVHRYLLLLQVLENDGSLLACALNAASTALTEAAVPMISIIGATIRLLLALFLLPTPLSLTER